MELILALTLTATVLAAALAGRRTAYRPRHCAGVTVADLRARVAADRTFLPVARGW